MLVKSNTISKCNELSFDLQRIPKELKFLLEIIKDNNSEESFEKTLEMSKEINWNIFFMQVLHHRLYPLLYSKISKVKKQILPSSVEKKIYQEYKKNILDMLHLSAEMEHISKLFQEVDIPLLVLKGPVLAKELYGDLSLRTCRDLDILVEINDLKRIEKLFLNQGYLKDNAFQIDPLLKDWKWRHHHIAFFHPEKGLKIEVHWRLNPGPGKEPTFQALWDRRRTSNLTSHPIYYLGREDLFFFLVTHGARHGWSRLRWLIDIHKMVIQQENDWCKNINLMKENQSIHLLGQALILSYHLLDTPIPKELLSLTREKLSKQLAHKTIFYFERMINLHTVPLPHFIVKYHNTYLLSLKTIQQKILYFASVLYPSTTDVEVLKLPNRLYILYFPLRPLFWILRKTRKQIFY